MHCSLVAYLPCLHEAPQLFLKSCTCHVLLGQFCTPCTILLPALLLCNFNLPHVLNYSLLRTWPSGAPYFVSEILSYRSVATPLPTHPSTQAPPFPTVLCISPVHAFGTGGRAFADSAFPSADAALGEEPRQGSFLAENTVMERPCDYERLVLCSRGSARRVFKKQEPPLSRIAGLSRAFGAVLPPTSVDWLITRDAVHGIGQTLQSIKICTC